MGCDREKQFVLVFLLVSSGVAQDFQNLDFESAIAPATPNYFENPFAPLFPGWRGFLTHWNGSPVETTFAWYDNVWDVSGLGLSDAAVDTPIAWGLPEVLSGRFSALMVASAYHSTNQVTLQQTGLVPADARSLKFRTSALPFIDQVLRSDQWKIRPRINGELLEPVLSAMTSTQATWAVDVSKFAGTMGTLSMDLWLDTRLKPLANIGVFVGSALDDLEFSPEPVRGLPSTTNDALVTWGQELNTVPMPPGASDLVAVSAGFLHKIGLRSDGLVFAWGDHIRSCSFVPESFSNVVAVAGGFLSTYAVTADGDLLFWPSYTVRPVCTNVVAVSANTGQAFALTADGTVVTFGRMDRYFWGVGHEDYRTAFVPTGLSNVTAVAAGAFHGLALRADGSVISWVWDNRDSPFTPPEMWPSSCQTNVPPWATNVIAIAAGAFHNLALRADGTVLAWGENTYHQTNVLPGLSNVVAVAAGSYHSLALRADGTVVAWGDNECGQTNVPPGLTNVIGISAGGNQSVALVGTHPPVSRAGIEQYSWTDNHFAVSITTQVGHVYRLEYTDDLNAGAWRALPLVAGNGSSRVLQDRNATTTARFYRVRNW